LAAAWAWRAIQSCIPRNDIFQPVVQGRGIGAGVDLAKTADALQDPAPAELEADTQIVAEMLSAANPGEEPVAALFGFQMRAAELRVPVRFAIRHEVDHVRPRQRAIGVNVHGMALQQTAEVSPACARPEERAAGMIAFDLEALQDDVRDGHARPADRLDDFPEFGRRQHQGPVIVVHRADDLPLLLGVGHLGRTQCVQTITERDSRQRVNEHHEPPRYGGWGMTKAPLIRLAW
jgi:hypothetical protein